MLGLSKDINYCFKFVFKLSFLRILYSVFFVTDIYLFMVHFFVTIYGLNTVSENIQIVGTDERSEA